MEYNVEKYCLHYIFFSIRCCIRIANKYEFIICDAMVDCKGKEIMAYNILYNSFFFGCIPVAQNIYIRITIGWNIIVFVIFLFAQIVKYEKSLFKKKMQ